MRRARRQGASAREEITCCGCCRGLQTLLSYSISSSISSSSSSRSRQQLPKRHLHPLPLPPPLHHRLLHPRSPMDGCGTLTPRRREPTITGPKTARRSGSALGEVRTRGRGVAVSLAQVALPRARWSCPKGGPDTRMLGPGQPTITASLRGRRGGAFRTKEGRGRRDGGRVGGKLAATSGFAHHC